MNELQMKYFVLKPKGTDQYAIASRNAMLMYATNIQSSNPDLAKELTEWAERESQEAFKYGVKQT